MNITLDDLLIGCDAPFIKGILIEDQSTTLSDCGCYEYTDDPTDLYSTNLIKSVLNKILLNIDSVSKDLDYIIKEDNKSLSSIKNSAFNLYSKYLSLVSYWPSDLSDPAVFFVQVLGKDGNYYDEFYPGTVNLNILDDLQIIINSLSNGIQKNKLIEIFNILTEYNTEALKYNELYSIVLENLQQVSMCSLRTEEVDHAMSNISDRSVWADWLDTGLTDIDIIASSLRIIKPKTCPDGYYLSSSQCECLPSYILKDLTISIVP